MADPNPAPPAFPFERCVYPPWAHQRTGTERLVADPRGVLLADPVGYGGKTKQVVDSACYLYEQRTIDTLLVVCPSYARSVWISPDPLLGDFAKHSWGLPVQFSEFFVRNNRLPEPSAQHFLVVATNFEIVRRPDRIEDLVVWTRGRTVWLVIDEGWAIKNPNALQTKAVQTLAHRAARVTILNATPGVSEELYSQIVTINPQAYPVKNWWHWKARYAVLGGFKGKSIVGYREEHRAELSRIEARYVLCRDLSQLTDVPARLPAQTVEVRLTPATWKVYTSMRDEFVAWLSDSSESTVAFQAGTRAIRLAQILSGYVGGVEAGEEWERDGAATVMVEREVGREKVDALLALLESQPVHKTVVWCRFRNEMTRLRDVLRSRGERVYMLWGGQKPAERDETKRIFAPGSPDTGRAWMIAHPAAGGAALNFAGADLMIHLSHVPPGKSLITLTQAEGRVCRPGQTEKVRTYNMVALGPEGQPTYDHAMLASRARAAGAVAWTKEQWLAALRS